MCGCCIYLEQHSSVVQNSSACCLDMLHRFPIYMNRMHHALRSSHLSISVASCFIFQTFSMAYPSLLSAAESLCELYCRRTWLQMQQSRLFSNPTLHETRRLRPQDRFWALHVIPSQSQSHWQEMVLLLVTFTWWVVNLKFSRWF